ncbi:MptD family putative ECF transporter S component [Clostridiaceae bacterium M8S5]|nr:MptD family putative ECF transporter S component [Clostridiaceae bacterium M8S5]
MKNNKLNSKDLINIGIYTAIYLAIFFVVGMMAAVPILYPVSLFVIPILTGIPFMLFLTKVKKRGMVLIMGLILGLFWFSIGYTWTPIASYLLSGLLAELILRVGNYEKFSSMLLGFATFSLGAIGCTLPMWIMADTYMEHIREGMGDQYVEQLGIYMPAWMGVAGLGIIFVGALIGGVLGKKMLKKHFRRAGIA